MANIHLTLATEDYDHVRDLGTGVVKPQGIDLTHLNFRVEEIFYRFSNALEWDVSELSFGKYCSVHSQPNAPFTGIPVFISRVFRQSSYFIRAGGPINRPEDLKGRKIGIPEWSQTATIYARGWLVHQVGIPLKDVHWVQAGVNEPGRVEMAKLKLPDGVSISVVKDRALTEMLIAGEIDAIISAHPPHLFEHGDPRIQRLFPEYRPVEEAYFKATGIFPIMHTVAIRKDVFDRHPWVAMNLYNAFEEAKRRSMARVHAITMSQIPVPWGWEHAERVGRQVFGGDDHWPYGIEPNRVTIDAFLQYCHEQGVCHRRLAPEELYPREVQSVFRI
ncbi:MAG: ABC transporter substrate-binding protein [Alphaproteobacteria bacterium]|nr:ABC transporter substrate-binding protein [Alphaproteobacteria bacterium]